MTPLRVDPAVLANAAKLYETARNAADGVVEALARSLDANWSSAGSDSAGRTWSESYDPAAFKAVASGNDITNAFGKLHDLLGATSVNHADTEKANKRPPEQPGPPAPQLEQVTAPTFKGAFGGDSDPPFGWELISGWLQGHTWPNGNPDKLRRLGTAWTEAARGLRDASSGTAPAWPALEDIASGEMTQALAQMDLVAVLVEAVATQYEKLGSACDEWARRIEDAHREILRILAGALAAGLVAGVVAGFFTAGTGAAATTAGVGGAAGAAIVAVIVAFNGAAALAVGATVAAGVAVGGAVIQLRPLLEAGPTTFNADTSAGGGGAELPKTTNESVSKKLDGYLLNPTHPAGGPKAKWFEQALGFNRSNADRLGSQIVFNPAEAVETGTTQFGTKFNQVISVVGENGKTIDVTFAWIRNNDGVVRLVTGIPTPK